MALPDTLTKTIGGQPVYIWVTGGVVVIGGVVWYRKHKQATSQGTDGLSYDTTAVSSDGFSMPTGSAGGGGSSSVAAPAAGGQPGGDGSTAPVAVATGTAPESSKASPKASAKSVKMFPGGTVLRQGSTGSSVKALQRALNAAGFTAGSVDGVYGSQTARAVRAYQRSRGLDVDGVAGGATLGALMAGKGAATDSKPAVSSVKPVVPHAPWAGDAAGGMFSLPSTATRSGYST